MHVGGDDMTWRMAYGKVLGTVLVASLLEVVLSFMNPKVLKKMFPPIVTGTAVFLIGASLVGTGIRYADALFSMIHLESSPHKKQFSGLLASKCCVQSGR